MTKQNLRQIIKEWSHYKINGKLVERIRYSPKQGDPGKCIGCGVTKGKLHRLGCDQEMLRECPGEHKRAIDCDCSFDGEEDI